METNWYIEANGQSYGPYTWEQMYHMTLTRQITALTSVYHEQIGGWVKAYTIKEFGFDNKSLEQEVQQAIIQPDGVNQHNTHPYAKKKKRKRWLPLIAILIVFVMVITLVSPIRQRLFKKTSSQSSVQEDDLKEKDLLEEIDMLTQVPDKAIFTRKELLAEGTMNPERALLSSADSQVVMSFDELCIGEVVQGKIVKLEVENPPEDSLLNVYDFSVDTTKSLSGVITLEVPYDPTQIPSDLTAAECVSGVYYNEELHEWIEESYEIDESKHTVVIKTTHLSAHGSKISWNREDRRLLDLIKTYRQGTPSEKAIPINTEEVLGKLTEEEFVELFDELKNFGGTDPQQALNDASLKIVGDAGSYSAIGVDVFKLTTYSGKWAKYLGDKLGKLSGALVMAQLASDVYYEKPMVEVCFNGLKGLTFWQGATAAAYLTGPVGGTIATVVLAGMFLYDVLVDPIDIPKYIEETNHQTIVYAYDTYYHSGENYRSKKEWMDTIDEVILEATKADRRGGQFDDLFKELLDEEITVYATHFFEGSARDIIDYVGKSFDIKQGYLGSYDRVYSSEDKERNADYVEAYVLEILGGTYDGYTSSLQEELINDLKQEIYKETLPGVLAMRKEYQYQKQLDYLRQRQYEMCQFYNTYISLVISDLGLKEGETSQYANCIIVPKIEDMDSKYKEEEWMIRLNQNGYGKLSFNLIAHEMAGDFTQLDLYNKDDYEKILNGTAQAMMVLDIGTIASNLHHINIGKKGARIMIEGKRSIIYELEVDGSINHAFEAQSDQEGECSILWTFGDGSKEVKTEGKVSKVSHDYDEEGVYRVSAKLLDASDVVIDEDSMTIKVSYSPDLTGTWVGEFQITEYEDAMNYAEGIAMTIAKGITRAGAKLFGRDLSEAEIEDIAKSSIEVNEQLTEPMSITMVLGDSVGDIYQATIIMETDAVYKYETAVTYEEDYVYWSVTAEDGSIINFSYTLMDPRTLSGDFGIGYYEDQALLEGISILIKQY